ncbi:Disease resistance protein L6 [Linum perenne]
MEIWLIFWSTCLAMLLPLTVFFFSKFLLRIFNSQTSIASTQVADSSPPSDSSSSLPLPSGEYEVFLSFRGPDTRNNIADFLYMYLARSRVRTFRDDEELRKGEEIAPGLINAILQSKIYIPILSKTYASSKWCLKELAKMVECRKQDQGHVFFPIFYLVDPRDVRHQTGAYEEAFRLHRRNYDDKTVQGWKDALNLVGAMKGWHVTDSNGQGSVVDEVFEHVLSLLNKNYTLVTDELVGIDHHVEKVVKLLDEDSGGVKVVGIHGMGGLGKTTIATAVYNEISSRFNRCSFLQDVRETLQQHEGVVALQNKLISSITRNDSPVRDASEGLRVIQDRVCQHKVFIVLDDVDDKFECDKILGRYESFFPGSRFVITTRNKKVLTTIKGSELYEPEEMNDDDSLQLFSKHAFRMDSPPKEYATLSRQMVSFAAGLPLTLKVVGSLLYGEDKEVWDEKLMELKEIPPTEVLGKLKISYNALTDSEQQIFLDIACFFIGETREVASFMWNDCKLYPVSGINALILRSLIKIGPNNEFKMHEQLRDLGREIVREENVEHLWKRSRIWSNEDALDMLARKKGTEQVKALKVNLYMKFPLTNQHFGKLPELRYLEAHHAEIDGDFDELLSDLRWIRLIRLQGNSTPTNLRLNKLVILDVRDNLVVDDWQGWNQLKMAKKLKVLNLVDCYKLTKAPDLSAYGSLELLNLHGCSDMVQELAVGNLKNLKKLKLSYCGITRLSGGIGKLQKLEELDAWECTNLEELPGDIGDLQSLRILKVTSRKDYQVPDLPSGIKELAVSSLVPNLSDLKDLEELGITTCQSIDSPQDIWALSKLKSFDLCQSDTKTLQVGPGGMFALPSSLHKLFFRQCPLLEALPDLANLKSLIELTLFCCPEVPEIQGLGELKSLVTLDITDGASLVNLQGLENLTSLTFLDVQKCYLLKSLPNLANLKKVRTLKIRRCSRISGIPGLGEMESLEHLEIYDCGLLQMLPDLSKLARLKDLTVCKCKSLAGIEGIESMEALEQLTVSECQKLQRLPSLSKLRKLKRLVGKKNTRLAEIGSLEGLNLLESLELPNCLSLERLPDLSSLKSLKSLDVDCCMSLVEVSGFEGLESLESLSMNACWSIEKIPSVSNMKCLSHLLLSGCEKLTELLGVEGLQSLKVMNLQGCKSIELLHINNLRHLEKLSLKDCENLTELSGLRGLNSLKVLNMDGCRSLTKLASLSNLRQLEKLFLDDCEKLTEVPGLGELETLQILTLYMCTSIEKLPNISNLRCLHDLSLIRCEKLSELTGLESLESLQELKLNFCKSIEKLPNISALKHLETLSLRDCERLTEIEGIEGLECLKMLDMSGCKCIEKLPEISNLKRLVWLSVKGCERLTCLVGLEELKSLNFLDISGCRLIEEIPHLANTKVNR